MLVNVRKYEMNTCIIIQANIILIAYFRQNKSLGQKRLHLFIISIFSVNSFYHFEPIDNEMNHIGMISNGEAHCLVWRLVYQYFEYRAVEPFSAICSAI